MQRVRCKRATGVLLHIHSVGCGHPRDIRTYRRLGMRPKRVTNTVKARKRTAAATVLNDAIIESSYTWRRIGSEVPYSYL